MKSIVLSGENYHLPNTLNDFQQELYIHLINWKWAHITREPGSYKDDPYDAILPDSYVGEYPMLYPEIRSALQDHLSRFPFRIHKFFNHMASSQAANINLFLPILHHPAAGKILNAVKSDFARLAVDHLDHGYRIEFWDEPYGNLGDKTNTSGTDSDIAIVYYNHQNELCLWLIEHKLSEGEFTTCGGYRSPGNKNRQYCRQPFTRILEKKALCYYPVSRHFKYWEITDTHQDFFPNHIAFSHCPFQGGLNQLWRNQLLALSIEADERQPFQKVFFSMVRHPRNSALNASLAAYQQLIGHNSKFSVLTSADLVSAAASLHDPDLDQWVVWYRDLYAV